MGIDKYFVHDELNSSVDFFNTYEEAEAFCKEIIRDLGEDGWPEELLDGGLKMGIVTHESCKTNERPLDGANSYQEGWSYLCDVEMIEIKD